MSAPGRPPSRRRRSRRRAAPPGPNWSWPPLWLSNGWSWASTTRALPGSARRGSSGERSVRDHPGVAGGVRVVDIEAAAAGVVRREGHREKALLGAPRDLVADLEEGLRQGTAILDHADSAGLLDHEQVVAIAPGLGDVDRLGEVPDLGQLRRGANRGSAAPGCGVRPAARPGLIGARGAAAAEHRGEQDRRQAEGGGAAAHRPRTLTGRTASARLSNRSPRGTASPTAGRSRCRRWPCPRWRSGFPRHHRRSCSPAPRRSPGRAAPGRSRPSS